MEPHDGKQVEEKQRGPVFPANVRMLIWADSTLFHSYEAVLPPTPPPRSASKDSLCSVDRPEASPIPPVDPLLDQDWSSPLSGFEEVLPPNQEARPRSPTVPHTEPALPLSPSMPPSHHSQSQPPSDPMMAMFRSLMSSFQSELKTLRSDLSGSMSTMVAEAVAAHLPQVPYQFQTKFFMYLFIVRMLPICSPYNCYTLHTIPRLLEVVIVRFCLPPPSDYSRSTCSSPAHGPITLGTILPVGAPRRTPTGTFRASSPSGFGSCTCCYFYFSYIVISVFIHLGRLQSFYIYVSSTLYCLIYSVLVFGGMLLSSTSHLP